MNRYLDTKPVGVVSLLAGAVVWGIIWYPYRLLADLGVPGLASTTLTYAVAFALGVFVLKGVWREVRPSWALVAIGLAAGACNLGYVLATLHGTVMRVLLLFYLAPLWTVLLARVLLHERLNRAGAGVIGLSLAGAFVMLWHPQLGAPVPRDAAEWIGMAAGFLFALSNVLIRRAADLTIRVKSMAVFIGAMLLGLGLMPLDGHASLQWPDAGGWLLIGGLGLVLLVINLVVQHGLTLLSANQAIVILLFELVVAAVSSWLLAGEQMSAREWVGGAMIVAASLLSGQVEQDAQRTQPA